jgi:hypothetical protein
MKPSADWISWILQFLLGLPVGCFAGMAIISKGRRGGGPWMDPDCVPVFLWGAALVGGALASWYGDRLWFGGSYRVIAPDGVHHNRASRGLSIVAGVAGSVLGATALLRHFGLF